MGKLFQLRAWLTVEEAARHLSTVFKEDVSAADILRLSLDGKLVLSVDFVNHAKARRGQIVPLESAQRWEVPGEITKSLKLSSPESAKPITMLKGINIDGKRVLELDLKVVTLNGVYDLPMIGGEALDIEHEYQRLTSGPAVTLSNLEGAFVHDDEAWYQLQDSYDDNKYQRGSRAALEELQTRIEVEKLNHGEADRLLKQHAEDRKKFLEKRKLQPAHESYHPAGGIPADAVLVVRTKALRELQERVESESVDSQSKLGTRAETTYQNIIGALLDLMLGRSPAGRPHSLFKDQAAVIEALLAANEGKPGISRRTLEEKFAAAKRSLIGG